MSATAASCGADDPGAVSSAGADPASSDSMPAGGDRFDARFVASDSEALGDESSASSPIIGWLVPNYLDTSVMFFDADGVALGSLLALQEGATIWDAPPGRSMTEPRVIDNADLDITIDRLERSRPGGLADFLIATETTLTAMDDDAAQADSLAVLMGRPTALVRVAVDIATPPTDSNPDNGDDIRFGTGTSSPDGLVGIWVDTPPTADASNDFGLFRSAGDAVVRMDRSVTRVIVSMLLDPGRGVHVASGSLPAVELSLEPDQYSAALKQIEISFRTAPILTDTGAVILPVPGEAGGEWSWVQEGSPDDAGFTD